MFERGTILHVDIYIYMYLLASDATCSGDKCAQHVPPPVSSGDRSSGDSYAARQTVVRQATPFFCLFPTVGHDTRLCPPTVIACYCGPPHPILSCGQYYIRRFCRYECALPESLCHRAIFRGRRILCIA